MSISSATADLDAIGFHLLAAVLGPDLVARCRDQLGALIGEGHALRHVDRRLPTLVAEVCTALTPTLDLILGHCARIARGRSDRMVLHLVLGPTKMAEAAPWSS